MAWSLSVQKFLKHTGWEKFFEMFGLIHYAKVLYDTKHQSIFFKIAYKNLKDSLTLDITPEARNGFLKIISELENRLRLSM